MSDTLVHIGLGGALALLVLREVFGFLRGYRNRTTGNPVSPQRNKDAICALRKYTDDQFAMVKEQLAELKSDVREMGKGD